MMIAETAYQSLRRPTKSNEIRPSYRFCPNVLIRPISCAFPAVLPAVLEVRASSLTLRPEMPRCAASRPESLWPWPKNFVRASTDTSGLVNRNTTKTSMIVVRPSANAKPRTTPIAKMNSTSAARIDTRVGRQDRASRTNPACLDRESQRLALADLVSDALEEHDERVGGDADRHDESGDARQGQREADATCRAAGPRRT